jgi:hypothetical protein
MYVLEKFTFTASGPTSLDFTSQDANSFWGPVIGAVDVSAVPEPATLAPLGAGMAGLGLVRRKRAQ